MDPRVQQLADVLVNYSIGVQPGQWIVIESPIAGEPLAVACQRAVLRAGGLPSIWFDSEAAGELQLNEASDEQLQFISPFHTAAFERADGRIHILAPTNTRTLSGIEPRRLAVRTKATEHLSATFMRRWQAGELRWNICQFPTQAAAQDAGMSLHDYEEFVYGAGLLGEADPIAAWQSLVERQQRLIDWLQGKSEIHITGPGTDLRLAVGGRTWVNDRARENFPGGEIFTSPHEDATEGVVQFNFPAVYGGREVSGVRLTFKSGKVVEVSATGDEAFLREMLDMDEGARRLGEFAIGTNPGIQRFTRNTLFDEKIGGTLHMALGRSIPGTGGDNQSALHWDMVRNLRDGAEITVDGQPLSRNGELLVA
jgi:aminopeptidase